MHHHVGQVVCLWQEDVASTGVTVLKEILVTITEIKTGVPGEFSGKPVPDGYQSLRGVGDDGETYEKHWESWPESQTNDFMDRWSVRDDGEGENPYWHPKEAVYAYNQLRSHNRDFPNHRLERRDRNDQPVLPKGDVVYCEKHDEYDYKCDTCLWCRIEARKASAA